MQIIVLPSSTSQPRTYHLSQYFWLRMVVWLVMLCIVLASGFYHFVWQSPAFLSWLSRSQFAHVMPAYHATLHLSPYEQTALRDRIVFIAKRLQTLESVSHDLQQGWHIDLTTLDQQAMDSDFSEGNPDAKAPPLDESASTDEGTD